MSMFRFWASDSRGSDKTAEDPELLDRAQAGLSKPAPSKRRRPESVDTAACAYQPAKRIKTEQNGDLPSPVSASADGDEVCRTRQSSMTVDAEAAKEAIQMQFGLEILLKHDELRLINQELARCQIALEQLRRCHLIPYPVHCPTPQQMLEISSGKGPAVASKHGEPVPKWAPPFGVVEGPYARHYAKWLIPDPMFDGIEPEPQGLAEAGRTRTTAEGRATRSSISDVGASGKQRPARGSAGQKLQALSSGYPQPRDKQSGCILKRPDGVTVKLVCIDCHRWDFSSTQGFINHCRIAHKREFKSHDMAAIQCGQPIEVDESGAVIGENRKAPPATPSGLAHPLARPDSVSENQPYKALLSRISASLDLYKAGKLPGVSNIPGVPKPSREPATESSRNFVASSDVPYLSRLMKHKKLSGNLKEQVTEAKAKVDWDVLAPTGDSDAEEATTPGSATGPEKSTVSAARASAARTPAVMRMPSRAAVSPSQPPAAHRAACSKKHRTETDGAAHTNADSPGEPPETPMYDDEMEGVDLSPNTVASNNAPSLVSDDGEYDDSDDGSASESSDDMETGSVSDVAEINIDDDSDAAEDTPRPVPRRGGSVNKAVNLKKDESRHVTFVSPTPVPTAAKGRRKKI